MKPFRRHLIVIATAGTAAAIHAPALAAAQRALAGMTDGPFYPPTAWRNSGPLAGDWDADLTRVERQGRVTVAQGEHLLLQAQVLDTQGRAVDGAEAEFWQCDSHQQYRHPDVALQPSGRYDAGFQGYGALRSGRDGQLTLRTIKPVPYPGRTPHIHVKLRHAAFGELSTQLFVADEPGNARDFLWRQLPDADRTALSLQLQPAPPDAARGLRWLAQHRLIVPT
ncbi:MAG: intradiol ring-cleavage dioxygenase [Rubrivivax sp.]|nr:intradiol ring-cleavage dioxygenase [Rubrivivax sp.]